MIDSLRFDHVIADTANDADWFLALLAELDSVAVIPPRANRTAQRDYDRHLYKERHLVESFINKLKWYRRIFTRFKKLARRYLAFIHFAAALIWLR